MLSGLLSGLSAPRLVPVAPAPLVLGAKPPPPPNTLTIATWNVAWGQGWGSELSGVAPMRTSLMRSAALARMSAWLAAEKVDVALLQEVDLAAARSGNVDQARTIAAHADMGWIAAAPSWDVRYLPFPYWPPSHHAGRIKSGGAIVSRFPIRRAWIETLAKPASMPAWYRAFYPGRYLMGAEIDLGDGRTLHALHAHLEAFDSQNRRMQAGVVASRLAAYAVDHPLLVFGGDLNTVPPDADPKHGYPDEPDTDHRDDPSYSIIADTGGLTPVLRPPVPTFPAHRPSRMLDHLFVAPGLQIVEARAGLEVGDASDHLPVLARLSLDFDR